MPLAISVGHATHAGRRRRNEDFCGIVTPEGAELAARGALLAVADGVSGNAEGSEAAESAVRGVLADYYATPDTWQVPLAIERVLSAMNRWLHAQAHADRPAAGAATTLSLLVLRGNRYYLAHVGDTRIYRLRARRELSLLTRDHVWDLPGMRHVLKRALGLDQHLVVDYADGDLQPRDRFPPCSDGVWAPLGEKRIHELLVSHEDPQRAASALVPPRSARRSRAGSARCIACPSCIGT